MGTSSHLLRQTPDRCIRGRPTFRWGGAFVHVLVSRLETGPGLCWRWPARGALRALCFSELPLQKPCAFSLNVKCRAASWCSKVAVSPLLSGVSLGGVGVRGAVSLQRMPCSKGDLSCGLFECAALGIGRMFGRKWSPHDRPEVAAWVALLKIRTCVESTFSA